MEDDEQKEMKIEYFNWSKDWMEKIRRYANDCLSCAREYMEVDSIEEENKNFFGDAFLFAESMSLKKRRTALNVKTKSTPNKLRNFSTTKATALASRISVRTDQNHVKTYNNVPERWLPGSYSKTRGRSRTKLSEENSKFLVDYIEKNTTAILVELKLNLCEKLKGLKLSNSANHRHSIHKHNITLKKLEKNSRSKKF